MEDQRTDISRRELIKIARRLADPALARELLDAAAARASAADKTAGTYAWPERQRLPLDNDNDLLLSRAYFEGQREGIEPRAAARIEARLAAREALLGRSPKLVFKEREKTAAEPEHELLPGVRVAGRGELEKAGKDFSAGYDRLCLADRVSFARNFVKAVEHLGLEASGAAPEAARVYAGLARPASAAGLRRHLELRRAAALRRGLDGEVYAKLAGVLDSADLNAASLEELRALAQTLHELDAGHGLADRRAARRLPDAWHVVFGGRNSGEGEAAAAPRPGATKLNAAELTRRFGPGVLEETANPDGALDPERVAEVMRLFGDDDNDVETTGGGDGRA